MTPAASRTSISVVRTLAAHVTLSPLFASPGLRVPSVLEDAFVLPGWRRQDRIRVRPQVCGHVAKVRLRPRRLLQQTAAGGEGKVPPSMGLKIKPTTLLALFENEGGSAVVLSC